MIPRLLLAIPFLLPVAVVMGRIFQVDSWSGMEASRWWELAGNTLALVGLTLLLTVPIGTGLALLLARTDLPGRRFLRGALVVALLIPLPVYVSAWQMAIGPTGWLVPPIGAISGVWKPWNHGLLAAAVVHSLAALPWVIFFVDLALRRVENELEETAVLATSLGSVLARVSLRRILSTLGLISLLLALQTAGEITVTDVMLVRTFAEEVYNQYVLDRDAIAPLIVLCLPQILLLTWLGSRFLNRSASAIRATPPVELRRLPLRFPGVSLLFAGGAILIYLGVPLGSLLYRVSGDSGSLSRMVQHLQSMWATSSGLILESLLFAILVGMLATMAAVMAIRSALESSFTTRLLLVFAMLLLTVPAPVLGFGVKGAIDWLLDLEELIFGRSEFLPLRAMLYDLPSPLPVLWCQTVKFFPYAVAILLPLMKSIPREILEEFRLMGSSRWSEFRLFWWPTLRKSMVYAVLLIALFAMSEISASKLVEVPGRVTFAHELFRQMHYGANDTVAAFCLVQVALSIIVAMVMLRISNR